MSLRLISRAKGIASIAKGKLEITARLSYDGRADYRKLTKGNMQKYNIAIIGSVGVGKSTLATELSKRLSRPLVPENFGDNEYIENQSDETFSLQWRFLDIQAQSHAYLQEHAQNGIIDRTIYETYEVFTRYYKDKLTPEERSALRIRYDMLKQVVRLPDLVLYLHAPAVVSWRRMITRGREFEAKQYDLRYFEDLEFLYGGLAAKLEKITTLYSIDTEATEEQVLTAALQKIRAYERRFKPLKKEKVNVN